MKNKYFLFSLFILAACANTAPWDQVVSQKYVHKYGFDVSEEEWEERSQEGQVIALLKNGVKITRSYEEGSLHGPTTYSFPHSDIVEKALVYDQGALLKEISYDSAGIPIREEVYEFDDRTLITLWDERGAPLSIEEYEGELLAEGKYYAPDHKLEAEVIDGRGTRVKRDRTGDLLLKDLIEEGKVASRTTYHPNGQVNTVSRYEGGELHGEELKYSASGKPLMQLSWNEGILEGIKVVFRNGQKIAEVPYVNGKKEGIEHHYDDLGNLTAEILWKADKKHGVSTYYTEDAAELEWFYKGQTVSEKKFESLEERDRIVAELNGVVSNPSQ